MKQMIIIGAGLLAAFATIPASTAAQQSSAQSSTAKPYIFKGRLGDYNAPAKVYFDHMEGDISHTDSATLVNGSFQFSGALQGPAAVRMAFSPNNDGKEKAIYTGDVIYFYIGSENVTLNSPDLLAHATITGSAVNDAYNAYCQFIGGSIMALTKQVNEEFNKGTEAQKKDTTFMKEVDTRYRARLRDRNAKQLQFAKENPDSYFSLVALSELIGGAKDIAATQPVFEALNKDLRNSFTGKEVAARLASLSSIVPGSVAPDFTQQDPQGKSVSLSSLRGKYVLLDFWASWCGPCRAENPNVLSQYKLYHDKGFQVLSVSLDDNKKKWTDAITQDGMPWIHISDLKGWNNQAGKLYAVRGVPASFLIDPQGKIIAIGLRGEELNKKLATIFN